MDLLIVESKAKARTIQRYLGGAFMVRACNGHVQDLPTGKHEHGRKAMWAATTEKLPAPPWDWTENAQRTINTIRSDAKKSKVEKIFIATDPDREGEFIAWRLSELLSDIAPVHRIIFHEITKAAIEGSLANPGEVNMNMVDAAKVRRFMDRLVGFRTSKFARSWGLQSMGRVQTPALGFIVERELERDAFVPIPYFSVRVNAQNIQFSVKFHESGDSDAWRDDDGKFDSNRTSDGELAKSVFGAIESADSLTIDSATPRKTTNRPFPPFTTDTLLQSAGSRMGWKPAQTMRLASELYNAGHITYIRTDSTRTSAGSRKTIRDLIEDRWGADHLGKGVLGKKDASAQHAHEAIRPTRPDSTEPEGMTNMQKRLYNLVWARFAASQMSESRYDRVSLLCSVEESSKPLAGTVSWRTHAGWEAAFANIDNNQPVTEPPAFSIDVGAELRIDEEDENPNLIEDETKPPRRFRQHTLVTEMKARGIGRPSTYATTIEKLLKREYVADESGSLVPTAIGRMLWVQVAPMYSEKDEDANVAFLFSAEFTAEMEDRLDKIEVDQRGAPSVWDGFTKHFKRLHTTAQGRRKESPTPNQIGKFNRITERLSAEKVSELLGGREPKELTGQEMSDLIKKQLEEGPPPATESQTNFILNLVEQTGLSLDDALAIAGSDDIGNLTVEQASTIITKLKDIRNDQPRPLSDKQLKTIEDLTKRAELTEEESCKLVGCSNFDELTGGRNGTGSELIGMLIKRTGGSRRGRGRGRGRTKK